jgi:hypothetical protein
MSIEAEPYYTFLTREEALDPAPIDGLYMTPEHQAILKEAYRRMAPFLAVIAVKHLDYENNLRKAQLVVHNDLVDTIQARFAFLRSTGYGIQQMRPQVMVGYEDARAMALNYTSMQRPDYLGSPKRGILSKHFVGAAVDIEPLHNKMRYRDGRVEPSYTSDYEERPESMLMYRQDVQEDFSKNGFEYGGTWPLAGIELITGHPDHDPGAPADEHHFELRDQKLPEETHLIDMSELALPEGIIYEHPGRVRVTFA